MRDGGLRHWANTSMRRDTRRRISPTFRFAHRLSRESGGWAWNRPFPPGQVALVAGRLEGDADQGWHRQGLDALRHSWADAGALLRNLKRRQPLDPSRATRIHGSRMP